MPMLDSSNVSQFRPLVSIVIKTYDDSEKSNRGHDHKQPERLLKTYLQETLDVLNRQTLCPHEVLIIDSSEGDGIARLLYERQEGDRIPIRRIPLASDKFSHPKALNLGVREATGEIVSSLSGDATPANEKWLECLVQPLADPTVAGTYSCQIKRPGVHESKMERLRLWWRYRPRSILRDKYPTFSNASSAFRRELALDIEFDENLVELEDYDWVMKVRDNGYSIVYAGDSKVYHSHDSSSLQTLRRMIYYAYLRAKLHVLSWLRKLGQSRGKLI